MKYRWLSLLLVIVLCILTALTACTNSKTAEITGEETLKETKNAETQKEAPETTETIAESISDETVEVKTINVVCEANGDFSDSQRVEDAINEISVDRYGIRYKLTFLEYASYDAQFNMLLTGDEADLLMSLNKPLTSLVENGQVYDLTDYYYNRSDEKFTKAIREMGPYFSEEYLKCMKIKGRLYAVPNAWPGPAQVGLLIRKDVMDRYGINVGEMWSLDDMDAFLEKAHADYPDIYTLVPVGPGLMMNDNWKWDFLGTGPVGVLNDNTSDDSEVKSLFDTETFQDLISHTRSWYEKGYMMQDCLSSSVIPATLIYGGQAVCCFVHTTNTKYGNDIGTFGVVFLTDPMMMTANVNNLCWLMNANTKDPDASWKALQILYYDEEIAKLYVNGIKDVHFVLDENGIAQYPEGKDATNVGYNGTWESWDFPNATIAYSNYPSDLQEITNEFAATCRKGKAFGFTFDSSSVIDELTMCQNVMDKYYAALMLGAVDPDEVIPIAREEMKAAGEDVVIAEKQRQLDEWLASNAD